MEKHTEHLKKNIPWRNIISAIVLLLFAVLIVRNWSDFVESFKAIKSADPFWLTVAVVGMVCTYIAAAGGYLVVTIKKLSAWLTFLAQVAAAFANKLLPSGVGGLGLNVAFLHKNKYTPTEAATVTGVNSLAAFVSFSLLFIAALLAGGLSTSTITVPHVPTWVFVCIIAVLAVTAVVISKNHTIRSKLSELVTQAVHTVKAYRHQPLRLVGAVVMATLVTFAYLTALYASARSLGVDIGVAEIFFVYVFAAVATAAVPTPGGLGAAEAALYAGFVSYGVEPGLALSATLAYRFITYWIPILPGYLSFQYLQKIKML
jgi:glycosyltransferase 2 family protein